MNKQPITKYYVGKRLLVQDPFPARPQIKEIIVKEVSPSGKLIKVHYVNSQFEEWIDINKYEIVEVLNASRQDCQWM